MLPGVLNGKMRIAFVLPGRGLFGGVRVVANYGEALRRRGHEVRIVYFVRRPRGVAGRLKAWLKGQGNGAPAGRDYLDDFGGSLVADDPSELVGAVGANDVVIATHWLTADPVALLSEECGAKHYFIQGYEIYNFDRQKVEATWRLPLRKLTVAKWLRATSTPLSASIFVARPPSKVTTSPSTMLPPITAGLVNTARPSVRARSGMVKISSVGRLGA